MNNKSLIISILIYSLSFWLWRLPFILWLPIPGISPDTFDYFALVQSWHEGTTIVHPIDLPLGFPFLVYVVGVISDKIMAIIYVQFLLRFFSGLLLIHVFWKHFRWWAVPVSIALSIYVTDSFSLRYDTSLQTESLYSSFMVMTTAFLIDSLGSRRKLPLIFLSFSMFLVATARANGLYIYFLIPILFLVFLRTRQMAVNLFLLVAPAIILHTAVSLIKSSPQFAKPKSNRVASVINRELGLMSSAAGESYFQRKKKMIMEYARMDDLPSFYFSLLPERYRQLYELDIVHDMDYKMYDWTTQIPGDLRKLVYKEYYVEPALLKKNSSMMDVSYASISHPLFWLIHVGYKIQSIVFRNIAWYLMGLFLLVIALWIYLRMDFNNTESLLISIIAAVHFLSIVAISVGHNTIQPRYAHVSEFLLYLVPVLSIMLVLPAYGTGKEPH